MKLYTLFVPLTVSIIVGCSNAEPTSTISENNLDDFASDNSQLDSSGSFALFGHHGGHHKKKHRKKYKKKKTICEKIESSEEPSLKLLIAADEELASTQTDSNHFSLWSKSKSCKMHGGKHHKKHNKCHHGWNKHGKRHCEEKEAKLCKSSYLAKKCKHRDPNRWNAIRIAQYSPKGNTRQFMCDILDNGISDFDSIDLKIKTRRGVKKYQYKIGLDSDTDCDNSTGYSAEISRSVRLAEDLSGFADGSDLKLCIKGEKKYKKRRHWHHKTYLTEYSWTKNYLPEEYPEATVASEDFLADIEDGAQEAPNLDLAIAGNQLTTHYRFQFGLSSDIDCSDFDSYSDPAATLSDTLSLDAGAYSGENVTLCLIGERRYCDTLLCRQDLAHATSYSWGQGGEQSLGEFSILSPEGIINVDTATVEWSISENAVSYDVFLASDAQCTAAVSQAQTVAGTSAQFSNLTDGIYFSCVIATDGQGNYLPASNQGLQFEVDLPILLGDFEITGPEGIIESSDATVEFTVSTNAVLYHAFISSSADCQNAVTAVQSVSGQSALFTGLSDGDYYSCVSSDNGQGNTLEALNNGNPFTIEIPVIGPHHTMFVTSQEITDNGSPSFPPDTVDSFGHLDAADWVCSNAAANAGLLTSWDQEALIYRAVISVINVTAEAHIGITGDVRNTAGELIASGAADLWDGSIANAVGYDEFGDPVAAGTKVFTGSDTFGGWSGTSCGFAWENPNNDATVGDANATGAGWIQDSQQSCQQTARLYCVGPMSP